MVITLVVALGIGSCWGLAGFWLRQNTKLSIVEVSAWLTLVAGLLLPRLFVQGYLFALACTCVSYAIMANSRRISNYLEAFIVSLFSTLIVYFGQNWLVGIGGRLGSFAGIAVLWLLVLKKLVQRREKCDQTNSSSRAKT